MTPAFAPVPARLRSDAPHTEPRDWRCRTLRDDDRDALAAIVARCAAFEPDDRAVAVELIDAAIADLALGSLDPARTGYEIVVAERAGAIAGYLCFGATPMTRGTFDLYWIVTDDAHRGRGIARGLVDEMEHELRRRQGRLVRVETSRLEAYGAARAFYSAIGYPVASVLGDFYRPGDDLITYLKVL